MAKVQTIDVNNLDKDIVIKTNTKNTVLYLKGISSIDNLLTSVGNDLTITFENEHKIVLKDYFAKNGKFPIKTIKADGGFSTDLITYVNDNYIKGASQNIINAMTKTVNGTVFDDNISPLGANQTVNAGKGNDLIYADSGNDTLIGGVGTNEIKYEYVKNPNDFNPQETYGSDIIKLTKGETLKINITYKDDAESKPELAFERGTGQGANDLIIKNDANPDDKITIQNYYGKETGAKVLINGVDYTTTIIDELALNDTHVVKAKLNGSALADDIDVSNADPTKTTYDKKTKTTIYTGVTINAGAGDDTITGSAYNDTIIGGKGVNTLNIDVTQKFGNDIYKLTSGEKLNIVTNGDVEYTKDSKGNVVITADDNGSLTIQGLAKKDITQGVTINGEALVFDFDEGNISKSKITGTAQNDEIDIKDKYLEITTGKGKNRVTREKLSTEAGITINSGSGDDTITGTKYSDTITGGIGQNTIKILNETFGNDTINLTKGEQLILDMSAYTSISSADDLKGRVKVSGNNLLITTNNGTITLKNFAKSNVVNDGYVKVKLNGGAFVDLNVDEVLSYQDDFSMNDKKKTATFTGSRFDETVSVTGALDEYTKTVNTGNGRNTVNITNAQGETTVNGGSGVDIVNITNSGKVNAKLGNGENVANISGSGTNTIISGVDDDTININENTANTIIKAGAGENTININSDNFGNVILAEEKVSAKNIINFKNDINNDYTFTKTGNDLEISNSTSKITISGYFLERTSKTKYAEIEFQINGVEKTVENLLALTGKNLTICGSETILGTESTDNILANDYDSTVKASNDTITAGKGNDTINAGRGNNTIKFNVGDGNDIIENGGGNDTLVFKGLNSFDDIEFEKDNNNLVIKYGDSDTVTINNFNKGDYSVKNIKIGKTTQSINDLLGAVYGTKGNDNFIAKSTDEEFYLYGGNDTITFNKTFGHGDEIYADADYDDKGNKTNNLTLNFKNYNFANGSLNMVYHPNHADCTDEIEQNSAKDYSYLAISGGTNSNNGGYVSVNHFFNDKTPNLKIKDSTGTTYDVSLHKDKANLDWSNSKDGHFAFLLDGNANDTNTVISNNKKNFIETDNGAKLDYTYNGGIDTIETNHLTKDIYRVNSFNKNTRLDINDMGGNDSVYLNTTSDNVRLYFNVDTQIGTDENIMVFHKDSFNYTNLMNWYNNKSVSGMVYFKGKEYANDDTYDGLENLATTDYSKGLNLDDWKNSIKDNVTKWLSSHTDKYGNTYTKTTEVLYNGNNTQINELLKLFNVTYESTIHEPEKTPYELANMTMGTDGADTLVQTFDENNYSAYYNQLDILKEEYDATDEWIETYRSDLSAKAHDVSTKYSNVQGVLSDISWYEYLISNYDNPNYTGDTYFKHWSKEYYIDQLAQKNADAYGLTYTWETYRDTKLADYTEGTAEYNAALEDLNYSLEYARYQNTVDKYNKYQSYAEDTSTIPTFRDIALANSEYSEEDGWKYYKDKATDILRTLNGFKGSKQLYEELLDTYAKTHEDFATLKANYDNNNEEYEEAYNSAIEAILADENNAGIKAAYDTWQADLAKYNKYSEYSQNYYNAEYLGKDYNCDVEGKEYVSFRQEAEAERENKIIHDYYQKQYRYRTGQEYWSYKAELMNREINGYEGTVSRYNYFYMLSRDGNPLSIYYDLYREVRDEYNDYVDEYNTYKSYIDNWDNAYYNGEAGDDALTIDPDVWAGRANVVNVALNGRIYEYNTATNKLNGLVQYIKDHAPSETALQILTHLTTSSSGGIIIAKDGDDDITIGHIEQNTDNVSRGEVFAMGQGGNDIYRLENYGTEGAYGERIGFTIYDHEGTNTVRLNSLELNSGNIGIYANVTLVKDENGEYVTDTNGNYQYTLENFKTYLGLSSGSWSCMERSPLKNGDAGYSLLLVDAKTYSNKYAFDYGAMDQAGIKFDTETINHIDKIYANDGKYITQDQLREMFQKTANELAKMGYDSFMAAVQTNNATEKQHNLSIFTSSEVQGSLEWVNDATINVTGATEGLTGTDRNDNLTSTSANETFDLKLGNDTVTFEGEFGNDTIQSSSTVDNNGNARQADTLNLQDYSIEDRTLVLERNGNDLVLKAYADDKTTLKGTVTYKDFLNGETYNSRKFVLNAKDHTYMIWFNEAQERANQEDVVAMDIDDQGNNFYNIRFIKSLDNGLVRIAASENRSSYIVLDNTPIVLYKNTNIGTKEVISYGNADDQYREALSETTDLIIKDNGGNDSLEITGGYYDTIGDAHMRYFFDITDEGEVSDAKHIIWTDNFYTPNKEEYEDGSSQIVGHSYATENLIKLLNNDTEHMKGAITIYGDIEEIENDNHPSLAYNYKMSYNKVVESTLVDVVPWLKDNDYSSVTDALTQLQAGIDAKQKLIEQVDLSSIQYDEYRNAIPSTIPEEYTQLKTEQDAIQAKINELLGFYNKGYEVIINTNIIGTDGNDEITATSDTKYIEVKEGDDTVDLLYTSHGNHVEYYYDFERGDGHDTFIKANEADSICVNKGSSDMYTKFRTDGWDLKIEFYSNADATENPQGSILLKDYFYNLSGRRIDKFVIKSDNADDVEYSIDTLLRQPNAVLNAGVNVAFGTAGNDTFEGTNGNDIYYIGAGDDTITCSAGNDTYYLSNVHQHHGDSTFIYTIGNGDDVIYGGDYLTCLTLNYNNNDISMEFRENGDDLRMVFFDYDGVDRGSITIKDYKNTARLCLNHPDSWVNTFYIKRNSEDEGTSHRLADLIKQYTDMGGSLAENNDSTYINIIRITPETANGLQLTNSGKVDRLIFDNTYNTVTGNLSGNDLVLTYGDSKTLVVKGYVSGNSSIYDVKVNGEYTTLGDLTGLYYGTTGDDTFIHSTEDNVVRTYNLNTGNDIVEFPVTPNRYDAYADGTILYNKAIINSQGGTQYIDTIKLEDYSLYNNNRYAHTKLKFGLTDDGNSLTIKGERDFNPTTNVNYHKYTDITYNNFMSDSTPNLKIQMSYGDYDKSYYEVHKYNTAQNLDTYNSFDYVENTGHVLCIKDTNTSHTSNITSGSYSYSQIVTTGGAALNFTGHDGDIIVTNSSVSNDTYNIEDIGTGMKLFVTDKGGTNDTLNIQGMQVNEYNNNFENLFLAFNVNRDGTTDDKFTITYGYKNQHQNPIWNTAMNVLSGNTDLQPTAVVIDAAKQNGKNVGIEHVYGCSSDWNNTTTDLNGIRHPQTTKLAEIDMESWYSAIKQAVVGWMTTNADWMTENNLNSTADVFNFYNNNNSAGNEKAQSLINVYENYNASQYLK